MLPIEIEYYNKELIKSISIGLLNINANKNGKLTKGCQCLLYLNLYATSMVYFIVET